MDPINVLVTGGAGYIGGHTCKALRAAGGTPITFDNLSTGHRDGVQWGPFVEASLADRNAIVKTLREHQIEAVIHFAARAYVGESMVDPEGYFQANVINTLNLLAAMRECRVNVIVSSSTCAVYGAPETIPMTEQQEPRPVNPYGDSKLFVERALHWYGQAYGLRYVTPRYFNASGADPDGTWGERHMPETHLIPLAIMAAMGSIDSLSVFGTDYDTPDGTAVRDYIHVADLARAHIGALEYLREGGESQPVNLGTGIGHSVREVIATVEAVSGLQVPVVETGRRAGDPPRLIADPTSAKSLLGWTAEYTDLTETVGHAWSWAQREALAA